jgi:hypothetical protein
LAGEKKFPRPNNGKRPPAINPIKNGPKFAPKSQRVPRQLPKKTVVGHFFYWVTGMGIQNKPAPTGVDFT